MSVQRKVVIVRNPLKTAAEANLAGLVASIKRLAEVSATGLLDETVELLKTDPDRIFVLGVLGGDNVTPHIPRARSQDYLVKASLLIRSGNDLLPLAPRNLKCPVKIRLKRRNNG